MTRTKAKAKQAESETVQEVAPDAAAPELVVTSIKGFSADWTCRGFQFEFGKTYEVSGPIKACENGFHACPTDEHPLSVFEYYASAGSRFAEVTQAGASDKQGNKLASAEITIGVEVSISDLVARAFKWVWDRATLVEGSSATGDRGAASATGNSGAASATGDSGAASATGKHSVAMAVGVYARAMAGETSCICLAHRDPETDVIIAIRASKVGENGVKAGVWYSLNAAGEFIEESAS